MKSSHSTRDESRIDLEIIQVKNEHGFKEVAIQKLIDHLPLLLSPNPPKDLNIEFNDRLIERFNLFKKAHTSANFPTAVVRVRYITKSTDNPNEKVERKADRLRKATEDSLGVCDFKIELIGARELNQHARQRQIPTLKLQASQRPTQGEKGGIVCLVNLREWNRFITDESGMLREGIFEENVRGFAGNTRINRSIAESLHNGDDGSADFWWLNNGVTVLGRRVQPRHTTLTIEDPQIVNGLQTSRSIYQYFRNMTESEGIEGVKRQLLVRIIEASDEALASQIIRATNSQNRVDSVSLRATEPVQRDIEEFFGQMGYYYERKKNSYKNQGKPRDRIVEVLEVAQAMGAIVLCEPHVSRGQPSALIRSPRYERIFDSKVPYESYLNATMAVRRVEEFLQGAELSRQGRSNIRFQLTRTAVALALKSASPRANQIRYINPAQFDFDVLASVYEWVLDLRNTAEGVSGISDPNVLSKGAEWSRKIDDQLRYFAAKNRWPLGLAVQ